MEQQNESGQEPMPTSPMTPEGIAQCLYEAYCNAVGGAAFNGDPLPTWDDFSKDPAKEKQANGWRIVAERAILMLSPGHAGASSN